MKKISLFIAAIAALFSFDSCKKENELSQIPVEEGYKYTFVVNDVVTSATLDDGGVTWELSDRVGMYLEGYTGYAEINTATTPNTAVLYSTSLIPANSYAYAYYPYDANNDEKTLNHILLPNVQDGGSSSAMPLAGVPFKVVDEVAADANPRPNGAIQFLNLGSVIDFRVFSSTYSGETIKYITFTATSKKTLAGNDTDLAVSGDGYLDLTAIDTHNEASFDLTFGLGTDYDYASVNNLSVGVADSKGNATTPIYMVVAPGIYTGTITIGTDAAVYTFNYSNKTLARNGIKKYNMDLDNAVRAADPGASYTWTFANGDLGTSASPSSSVTKGDPNMTWSADYTWSSEGYFGWSNDNGLQVGSGSKPVTSFVLSTSGYSDLIKNVVINFTQANSGNASVSVSVGDVVFNCGGNVSATASDQNPTNYVFTNASMVKGDVVITFTNGAAKAVYVKSIAINPDLRSDPELSYATDSYSVLTGGSLSTPVLSHAVGFDGAITYSSDHEDVVSVNASTGEVTIVGTGTATVTASFAGDADWKPGNASYTVTVGAASLTVDESGLEDAACTAGATASFTVTSNVPWSASTTADYVTSITPSGEQAASASPVTVTVTFAANAGAVRTATVNIRPTNQSSYSALNKAVLVTQSEYINQKIDVLNFAWHGVAFKAAYTAVDNLHGSASDAIYSVQLSGGDDNSGEAIQIRSNNSNSGIVTTTSGGMLKRITLAWNSYTTDTRTVDVYAKNTPYSAPTDLYGDAAAKGTKVASFTKSAGPGSYTFTADYEYIGIRSNSGAIYIDEIDITWTPVTWDLSSIEVTTPPTKTTYEAGEFFNPNGMVVTAHYVDHDDALHTKSTVIANGDLTFSPSTSTALTTLIDEIEITYNGKSCTQGITVNAASSWALKSIAVTTPPTKVNYVACGQTFNTAGLVVTATYEDVSDNSNTKVEVLDNGDLVFSPSTSTELTASDDEITISYTDGVTKSTTQAITVYGPGTSGAPHTASTAVTIAELMTSEETLSNAYVVGIISEITTAYSDSYHNISFNISDDGSIGGSQFNLFRAAAASASVFNVGDYVKMTGTLKNYGGTKPQLDAACSAVTIIHAPTFSPDGGSFNTDSQNVTLSADDGSTIRYTTDGTDPTLSTGSVYNSAISITATTTIKAIAVKDGIATGVISRTFTKVDAGDPVPTEVTISIADYASSHSWNNGTKYSSVTVDSNVSVTVSGGSNSGKYYTSGNEWRLYQTESSSLTITASAGHTIQQVKYTYNVLNTGVLKKGNENITSNTTVDVGASSLTLTVGNSGSATNGQVKITSIYVKYL